jgi:subfamily B ATP-binding cassette protein MsbA
MHAFLKLLGMGRGKYHLAVLGVIALLLFNVLNALTLTFIVPFLEILFTAKATTEAAPAASAPTDVLGQLKASVFQWLQDRIATEGKQKVLLLFSALMMGAILVKNLLRVVSAWLIIPFETQMFIELRRRVYEHMTRLSLGYYTHKRKGQLLNLVVSDIQVVEDVIMGAFVNVISNPLTMLFLLSAMVLISWKLTLITLTILPITALVISRISKSLKKRYDRSRQTMDAFTSAAEEFISGVRVVKNFSAEGYQRRKFTELNLEFAHHINSFRRRADFANPLTEVLSFLIILLIVLYGGYMILDSQNSELKPSEFIGFIILFFTFINPLRNVTGNVTRLQKLNTSYGRIAEFLQSPVDPTEATTGIQVKDFQTALTLDNVSFGYGERQVLRNLSLTIRKGESVALVGSSGSGKSTLADLICRFYDPTEGRILLDSVDYRELDSRSLRGLMGVVAQEGILFNDTVFNNIAFGAAEQYTLAQVQEAAQVAGADGFIRELPQGYDTQIGERGTRLSGGQRQRLSIARAVLKNPPILILDEATSALDTENERLVQLALERLMDNRTSILIAHRLSTITRVDRIIVLEQGQVVEEGTHEELLTRQGVYHRLWKLQLEQPGSSPAAAASGSAEV